MKTLIICYSFSGTNRKLAQEMAKKIKADHEEIIELVERKGFWKTILVGGFQSLKKITTPIKDLKKDPKDYERVIVFSPVWAGSVPPATRAFLNKYAGDIKELEMVFACGSGQDNEVKILPQLREMIKKEGLSAFFISQGEIKKGNSSQNVMQFLSRGGD